MQPMEGLHCRMALPSLEDIVAIMEDLNFQLAYETALTIKGGMEECGGGQCYSEVVHASAAEDSKMGLEFYSIVMGCMGCILALEGKKLSDVPKFNLKAYDKQQREIREWEARFPNAQVIS
jgi:hypothetical protein